MTATTITSPLPLALRVRASVARAALQAVLELTTVSMLLATVPVAAGILVPAMTLFASASVLLLASAARPGGGVWRGAEWANAGALLTLLAGSIAAA